MRGVVPEPRTAVMTLVVASWKDQSGTLQTVPARMEDKSAGGACIRIKTPIEVGSTLRIQWRFEQFSGVTRYCRTQGGEYLVGIQRHATGDPAPSQAVCEDVQPPEPAPSSDPPVSTAQIETPRQPPESKTNDVPSADQRVEST